MKPSGVGGQAVMEGVMMRNKGKYAVAVRKPDKEIIIDIRDWNNIGTRIKFLGLPFIRGTVNLIESMVIGMKTLTYSANFVDVEEEPKKEKKPKKGKKALQAESVEESAQETVAAVTEAADAASVEVSEAVVAEDASQEVTKSVVKQLTEEEKAAVKEESVLTPTAIFFAILLSLTLSIGLFFFLPLVVSELLQSLLKIDSALFISTVEGVVRILIFVAYVALIGLMPDIQRVFQYHGAEHKTINCIEHGLPLTVENARASSKEHKRCGTSFMILVMVISILVFSVVNAFPIYTGSSKIIRVLVRFGVRLLLLPVVAGISYEVLKLAGRKENVFMNIISRPGMWMQALTTKEPDDSMLEVAIASVEAVFDWQAFAAGETGDLYPKQLLESDQESAQEDDAAQER